MSDKKNETNARRLVGMLIRSGRFGGDWIQSAQIEVEALRELGLAGADLVGALVSAGEAGWIVDGPLPGSARIKQQGEVVGKIS
jgi:hypothetical protein